MCHTVLFITGMLCWFDSPTWSWCPSSTNHKIQKPPFHTTRGFIGWRIWSSHWRPTRTNQGLLFCCHLFLYKYILIYVKRFIFFVSVIWVSVTIKSIHLVLFWIVFFAFCFSFNNTRNHMGFYLCQKMVRYNVPIVFMLNCKSHFLLFRWDTLKVRWFGG